MKKIIVPIILAAVLGVGGGAAAVIINRVSVADNEPHLPEIKYGKYYLNGDVNSDLYVEVTEDYIATRVVGVDPLEKFEQLCRDNGYTEEMVETNAVPHMEDYCAENKYVLSIFGTEKTPYMIMTHYNEEAAAVYADNGYRLNGSGYVFDGHDVIRSSFMGEFIYVAE